MDDHFLTSDIYLGTRRNRLGDKAVAAYDRTLSYHCLASEY